MPQSRSALAVILVAVAGLLAPGFPAKLTAQVSTPTAAEMELALEFEIAPGVFASILPVPADPPSLYRLRFDAGVIYPFMAEPPITLVYVESGNLVLEVDMPVTVTRSGNPSAGGENVGADTEFSVAEGDYFVLPSLASGEVRNEGGEPALVAVASLLPEGAGMPVAATPTP